MNRKLIFQIFLPILESVPDPLSLKLSRQSQQNFSFSDFYSNFRKCLCHYSLDVEVNLDSSRLILVSCTLHYCLRRMNSEGKVDLVTRKVIYDLIQGNLLAFRIYSNTLVTWDEIGFQKKRVKNTFSLFQYFKLEIGLFPRNSGAA